MQMAYYMLQTKKYQSSASMQVTMDQDCNVPDTKPDIEKLVADQGEVRIEQIKVMHDRLIIKGILSWQILYLKNRQTGTLDHMEGQIPFEEVMNMDGLTEEASVRADWTIEDFRTVLVHSRKISVRAIVTLKVTAQDAGSLQAASGTQEEQAVYTKTGVHTLSELCVRKRDTLRIKEEVQLPANKANIYEILWGEVHMQHVDSKLQDGRLLLKGDSTVFILYNSESEEQPFEYIETDLPWHEEISESALREDMVGHVHLHKVSQTIELKPDMDGEMRTMLLEIVLEVELEAYEEKAVPLLLDIYSLKKKLEPVYESAKITHLLLKNQTECRLKEKIQIPGEPAGVLQVCHPWAEAAIDRTTLADGGIQVEGVAKVSILYVNGDDHMPLDTVVKQIPFACLVETGLLPDHSHYEIEAVIDQLSAVMSESGVAEIHMTIRIEAFVFESEQISVMTEVTSSEFDESVVEELPNMIGYVAAKEDDLFELGKRFYTTQEMLMQMNGLETPQIREGDKLLIMKQIVL